MGTPLLKAVDSDRRSPRRLMAKYCRILWIATKMNSPALVLVTYDCLVPSPGTSPQPPAHPHIARTWGRWIDLYPRDSNGQNYANCEFLLDSEGKLISFSLFTYSFMPKWASVSAVQKKCLPYQYRVLTLSLYCLDTADSAMRFTKQNKHLQRVVLRELKGDIPNTDSRAGDILFFLCGWG